jgi:GTP-binding protein
VRNIAIIAHVDHGKTTLVDKLLQQSGSFRDNQRVAERVMDSNDLEKERGITILAKATSVVWKDTRINIVDTPGHADFGGEVERILSMVDGAIVLVDAAEGPDAADQVRGRQGAEDRAEARSSAINKIDRPDARHVEVINEVFDLFAALDATTSSSTSRSSTARPSRAGWATRRKAPPIRAWRRCSISCCDHVAPPKVEDGGFRMLGTLLEANPYLGRIITGRVFAGSVKPNQPVKVLDRKGNVVEQGRVSKILAFRGIERQPIDEAEAGDIIAIAGLEKFNVADTLAGLDVSRALAGPADRSADALHDLHGQ